MAKEKKYDLEDRLIDFAVMALDIAENLPRTQTGLHIAGQLSRSGTSPAANYGEAQGAESRRDFIHKLKVSLKELKETRIWLKIIERKNTAKKCLLCLFLKNVKGSFASWEKVFLLQKAMTLNNLEVEY